MSVRLHSLLFLSFLMIACGPEITVSNPLAVVNWSPHDGASSIELEAEPSVCFSLPIDEGSMLRDASLRRYQVDDLNGPMPEPPPDLPEPPLAQPVLESDAHCIRFIMEENQNLVCDTHYYMVLEPTLRTRDGADELGVMLWSRFTTVQCP